MTGWAEGLGPWTPVIRGDKLYGRGGADDGYAIFGSLAALLALHAQGTPHARCVVMIEACEESGSYDLPYYVDHLAARIGSPSLVVCLDSGCGNYNQLWLTTSLRGMTGGNLTVQVLEEGVHSGDASGVVPSSSASCATCCRGSRIRLTVGSSQRSCTSRSRHSGFAQAKLSRKYWARISTRNFRGLTACSQ